MFIFLGSRKGGPFSKACGGARNLKLRHWKQVSIWCSEAHYPVSGVPEGSPRTLRFER